MTNTLHLNFVTNVTKQIFLEIIKSEAWQPRFISYLLAV